MKDLNGFLESGAVENYCLGIASSEEKAEVVQLANQFQEVRDYIEGVQQSLDLYLQSFSIVIPEETNDRIKNNILEIVRLQGVTISKDGELSDFINIENPASLKKLEALIINLHPPSDYENIYAKSLFSKGGKELTLVWVKDSVPMEEHPHLDESFLVLEGSADCNIDGVITKMSRGDFMRIPPESHHEVIITSPFAAKAIQCRIAI